VGENPWVLIINELSMSDNRKVSFARTGGAPCCQNRESHVLKMDIRVAIRRQGCERPTEGRPTRAKNRVCKPRAPRVQRERRVIVKDCP